MKHLRFIVTVLAFSALLVGSCRAEVPASPAAGTQRPSAISPLTQSEVEWLNAKEQEWATNIDQAVPYIRQKDSRSALAYTRKATSVISGMKKLLIEKGYNLQSIDRLVAMESLTDAYINMAKIAAFTRERYISVADFNKMRTLFDDTRKKLVVAEAKFHELPKIQEICRQFLGVLDEFEREVNKLIR